MTCVSGVIGTFSDAGPVVLGALTKNGAEQNAFTRYARRRLWFEVVDPGSIPGISTIGAPFSLLSWGLRVFAVNFRSMHVGLLSPPGKSAILAACEQNWASLFFGYLVRFWQVLVSS